MNRPICNWAGEKFIQDEHWRDHAANCQDCREILAVAEWMTKLRSSTMISPALPAAGYLLFKAQIRKRLLSATRIMLPIYGMTIVSGILLGAMVIGLVRAKTSAAAVLFDAIGMLMSSVVVMALAATVIAVVYAIASYVANRAKTSERNERNI